MSQELIGGNCMQKYRGDEVVYRHSSTHNSGT